MVVVAILMLIVLTMTLKFLMDTMQRGTEGVTGKRANERTIVALDQMGTDFRSTVSTERATGGGLGLDDLDFVEFGELPASAAERASFANEKLDLIAASPWQVMLMVPAGTSGTRCVTYDANSTTGRIMRTVSSTCPANGGNQISSNVVVPAAPEGAQIVPPFSYSALGPGTACAAALLTPTPTFDALNGIGNMQTFYRLVSVSVDLRSYALAGRAKSSSKLQTEFVFRSRMSGPYRRAEGCQT